MISDACFEVAEALGADGARPSAVERALNAFADELANAELPGAAPAEVFAELRAGMAAVNRAALPPAMFSAMAKVVQRYLDNPSTQDEDEMLRRLRAINATAKRPGAVDR
jgi:hypothetical protein